jgi:hypothetical protein
MPISPAAAWPDASPARRAGGLPLAQLAAQLRRAACDPVVVELGSSGLEHQP